MPQTERSTFLDPLWRRIAVLCACIAWVGLEYRGGDTTWVVITALATCYAVWSLFIAYKIPAEKTDETQ